MMAALMSLAISCKEPVPDPEPEPPLTPEELAVVLDLKEHANCYITDINHEGLYRFDPTVAGNGQNTPNLVVLDVKLVWQSSKGFIKDLKLSGGQIFFSTAKEAGNAVIAALNSADEVIWSWHIWQPEEQLKAIRTKNDVMIANLNLGALNNTPGDIKSYGLLYQWGRKDPFTGSPTLTGNTLTMPAEVYDAAGNTVAMSHTKRSENQLDYATQNPTCVLEGLSNGNWMSTENNLLWKTSEGKKTCFDPCPAGWRVPEKDILNGATLTEGLPGIAFSEDNMDIDGSFNHGYKINMSTGRLYFPAAGRYYGRYGMLYGSVAGLYGNYWSCDAYSGEGKGTVILAFQNGGGSVFMSTIAGGEKCDAYSVRCVKE